MEQKYSSDFLAKALKPIFEKFNPLLVFFFGSAFSGKTGPLSDIDLAILWPKEVKAPMIRSLELQKNIKDFFKDDRFEVGCLNGQNLSFCYTVIKTGECIYGTESDRVKYTTRILDEYLDFSYLSDEYNLAFDENIRRGAL